MVRFRGAVYGGGHTRQAFAKIQNLSNPDGYLCLICFEVFVNSHIIQSDGFSVRIMIKKS